MAGRPRTRRAAHLVERMLAAMRAGGIWEVEHLLSAFGAGPSRWTRMARWERAAARMAERDLRALPFVLELPDGRVAIDERLRAGSSETPLYVPAHWTAGTATP